MIRLGWAGGSATLKEECQGQKLLGSNRASKGSHKETFKQRKWSVLLFSNYISCHYFKILHFWVLFSIICCCSSNVRSHVTVIFISCHYLPIARILRMPFVLYQACFTHLQDLADLIGALCTEDQSPRWISERSGCNGPDGSKQMSQIRALHSKKALTLLKWSRMEFL